MRTKKQTALPKNRILSITIKHTLDDSPDTSWLGEYSNTAKSEFAAGPVSSSERIMQVLEECQAELATNFCESAISIIARHGARVGLDYQTFHKLWADKYPSMPPLDSIGE